MNLNIEKMDKEIKKCSKCEKTLKQSGPYARKIKNDGSCYKGPMEINYWCMNENCEEFYNNIKITV